MIQNKQYIIDTIIKREPLRPLSRIHRLIKDPFRALPYYLLATLSHIKPYKMRFKTLWGDYMIGYMPEVNTFYYYGNCEANLTNFLLRYVQEGMTIIDVGAHIGFYSLLAGRLVGDTGAVYSFEPTPWMNSLLVHNTSIVKNVHVYNQAVSNTKTTIDFADYGAGYGAYNTGSKEGSILSFKPKHITVETVSLDEFMKSEGCSPDFIKLDAEGFEHIILQGMNSLLTNVRPLITLEMANGEKWQNNYEISSSTLLKADYDSYEMLTDGYIKPCNVQKLYTYTNILFIPKEKLNLLRKLIQ